MKDSKYTPGPWHAVDYAGFWALQTDPSYGVTDDVLDEDKNELAPQNAKLAACSPELLESLQEMAKGWESMGKSIPNMMHEAFYLKAKLIINEALNQ